MDNLSSRERMDQLLDNYRALTLLSTELMEGDRVYDGPDALPTLLEQGAETSTPTQIPTPASDSAWFFLAGALIGMTLIAAMVWNAVHLLIATVVVLVWLSINAL